MDEASAMLGVSVVPSCVPAGGSGDTTFGRHVGRRAGPEGLGGIARQLMLA